MKGATHTVNSDVEERQALETGLWARTADEALAVEARRQQAIAEAAAVSRHDDRRLSAAAMAERDAIDAVSDGHLVDVPEAGKRRKP
jgi:hypothetical protein